MLFGDDASAKTLGELHAKWDDCRSCPLRSRRVCHGQGSENAKIVVVGQTPTANEGMTGKMMTDPGGRRIKEWVSNLAVTIGLSPEDVYYTNVCKCPAVIRSDINKPVARINNQGEKVGEVIPAKVCAQYLEDELDIIKPDIVIALGQKALQRFASHDPMKKIPRLLREARGRQFDYNGYRLVAITMPIVLNEEAALALDEDYEYLQKTYLGKVEDQVIKNTPIMSFEEAFKKAATCTDCSLCEKASHKVFGTGNTQADVMIVGEAPGKNEDQFGSPFVGQAGRVLHTTIGDLGYDSKDIYITNTVKCWPGPGNPDPTSDQMDECQKYLKSQINHIKPKLILAVGKKALATLTGYTGPMGRVRGSRMKCLLYEVEVMPTWHPAYVLRKRRESGDKESPTEAEFKEDIGNVLELLRSSSGG